MKHTTSQTTKHTDCDAGKPGNLDGTESCLDDALVHDNEADINLCPAHNRLWCADHYVDELGSRSDLIAERASQ